MTPQVANKFNSYPEAIRPKMEKLRALILQVVDEANLGIIEETLKWGEPSYIVKGGSTLRFDWKEKSPEQYAMYFNCNSKLVETFKEIYGEVFRYEGNRAVVFGLEEALPEPQLKHCIELSLKYHKVKHLPLLGA